ncbi:MAG: nitrilase-related carbon-nitrogen hydrolase [Fimbriimonadaceae bacterium]
MAAAAWKLRPIRSDGDFYGHFHDVVTLAHEEGADVVVIPENQSLELINLAPDLEERDVPAFLVQFAAELEAWVDRISRSSGLIIVGGSHLRLTPDGIKSVCAVGNGEQGLVLIEKNKLTTYEREVWRLIPGRGLQPLPDRRIGVTLSYDAEFPEAGRTLTERGVLVHVIPAFTRDLRGFQRVRWAAQARAIEGQIFTIHASLVGDLGREPVPTAYGSTAMLTPSMEPFPQNAVLGESDFGEEEVIVRSLDLDALAEARNSGVVRNWHDRADDEWRAPALKLEDESA